jgi:CHAT domain-containing protein
LLPLNKKTKTMQNYRFLSQICKCKAIANLAIFSSFFLALNSGVLALIKPGLVADIPGDIEVSPPIKIAAGHDSHMMEELLNEGDFIHAVQTIEQQWLDEYANYFQKELAEISLNADEIADTLALRGEQTGQIPALIYLLSTTNQLEILLVLPNRQAIRHSIPEAQKELLVNTANQLSAEITNPIRRNRTTYLQTSQQLYQWIIAPVELELQAQGIDTLIFCVGAGLRTLPWAVLHDGQQFLVEKYSLGLIPAFNLTETVYQDIKNSPVMAMGASEFADLSPLPAVPLELQQISQELWFGESFLNEEFTIANLRSQHQSQQFPIIHLATHAEFLPGDPSNSYIKFWQDKLTLDRIGELQLNQSPVELLVLSACNTAIGDAEVELGFAGLAVNSGVKSALASLWYVSDMGTLALMNEFYQSLQTAPIKAEALRAAQIAMLQGKVYIENGELHGTNSRIVLPPALKNLRPENLSHPYFWSAFIMVGNPW